MSDVFDDGIERLPLSFFDALTVSTKAFGANGERVVRLWQQYNRAFFAGELKPVPVLFVPTSPYGHWAGLCTGMPAIRVVNNILLMRRTWPRTREILLHEMVHQHLVETGSNPKHAGQPWCDEIMRISRDYLGADFWAGSVTVIKEREGDRRKSKKINRPSCAGVESIPMKAIATWPTSLGLTPPDLA